jgi:hypothetical protein
MRMNTCFLLNLFFCSIFRKIMTYTQMTARTFLVAWMLLFIAIGATDAHPIHASITTIDYNPKTKAFEVSVKIFADDLEEAVKRTTGTPPYLGLAKEASNVNVLLEQFLRKNIRLEAVTATLPTPLSAWKFIGKELEGEAVWCYIEIPLSNTSIDAVKKLLVQNAVLTDLYDDQTNLVNVQIGPVRRSTLLRKNKIAETLEFP